MTDQMTKDTDKKRRRRILALLLVLAAAIGVVGVTSSALMTDQATIGNNTFGTGTIDLVVGPTTAAFTAPNMMPGDKVYATFTVRNSGNQQLRYALAESAPAADALAQALTLTVKTGVTTCDAAGFGSGSTLGSLPTLVGGKVFGDKQTGAQAGDRPLNGGGQETLCAEVALPTSYAGDPSAALATVATFTFDAEQTINNP